MRPRTGLHKNLAAKNTLITSDADAVEAGFREKLATIEVASASSSGTTAFVAGRKSRKPPIGKPVITIIEDTVAKSRRQLPRITTSVRRRRVAAKTIRLRDKEHCKFVRTRALRRLQAARRPRPITFALLSPVLSATKGQRRIHGPNLPGPSPRAAPIWRRSLMAGPGSASIPCQSRWNFGGDQD